MSIKSTMRTTVKGILNVSEDGRISIETDEARYKFEEIFGKFNGEEVDVAMVLKEEE